MDMSSTLGLISAILGLFSGITWAILKMLLNNKHRQELENALKLERLSSEVSQILSGQQKAERPNTELILAVQLMSRTLDKTTELLENIVTKIDKVSEKLIRQEARRNRSNPKKDD